MNIEDIKNLRAKTQASYADCKEALLKSDNDINKAEEYLRIKGYNLIENVSKNTECGVIESYVHTGNRVGVLVEVKCQTDFVAKTEEFKTFAKEVAMQVASMKPKYIELKDIGLDKYAEEYEFRYDRLFKECVEADRLFKECVEADEILEKTKLEMEQWVSEVCLLNQPYMRDGSKTINDLLAELANKTNEVCQITRFNRWEIGEETENIEMEECNEENRMKKFLVPSLLVLLLIFSSTILMCSGVV